MRYWDSSALVPLLLREEFRQSIQDLLRPDPVIVTWWGSQIDCASVIASLEREGNFDPALAENLYEHLRELCGSWNELEAKDPVRETALRLLRVHPLRSADSLQLAAALVVADFRPSTLKFVCLDNRLRQAARLGRLSTGSPNLSRPLRSRLPFLVLTGEQPLRSTPISAFAVGTSSGAKDRNQPGPWVPGRSHW